LINLGSDRPDGNRDRRLSFRELAASRGAAHILVADPA
jgi:hypothetical protein